MKKNPAVVSLVPHSAEGVGMLDVDDCLKVRSAVQIERLGK
jgi:hypothetical protein